MDFDIKDIVDRAENAIKVNPEDYQKDGLWYCGKCHTPKQGRRKTPWGVVVKPMQLCQCGEKAQEEIKRQEAIEKAKQLRRLGLPDRDMERMTFSANDGRGDQRIINIAKRYVDNFRELRRKGKGLMMIGDTGTGKTFAAACIVNALIDQGYTATMTNLSREINKVQGMFDGKQEYIDSFSRYSLLVLDDVGIEGATQYRLEMIYNIVDTRYRTGFPLVVTTNIPWSEISSQDVELPRKRIYSRLLEMCIPVSVNGDDRRRISLNAEIAQYKDMLGIADM